MKKHLLVAGLLACVPLTLTACSKGPKLDGPNAPRGGSRSELIYQTALKLSEAGYCDRAMPMFVCLAGQGHGWEVAAQRAGQCAASAAELWTPEMAQADPLPDSPRRGHERIDPAKVKLHYAWQASPDAIRAEGYRQWRRAAEANWPSSQASLVVTLSRAGGTANMHEAAQWLQRYDQNARRKVYGGDDIPLVVRKRVMAVELPAHAQWRPQPFLAETGQSRNCEMLLGKERPHYQRPEPKPETEEKDGVIRLPVPERPVLGDGDGEVPPGR